MSCVTKVADLIDCVGNGVQSPFLCHLGEMWMSLQILCGHIIYHKGIVCAGVFLADTNIESRLNLCTT
jgi:hypothetical protein